MTLDAGKKLGPYEIIEAAGAGGMGEVYKARDTRLDRTVAIKVLPARTAFNKDLRARFEREAKAISSMNHPNICTLHDIGHEDGIDYLVMEFLEGETLSERLKKSSMEVPEILEIASQIADALDKAHSQGLIHRDLKPANVILTAEGAKLLDFGLAKLTISGGVVDGVSGVTQTTPLTGTGTIIGTIQYMSPEQLEGQEADSRSDIFAFGVMLYEMIAGNRAFEGRSQASLIASILKETPQPLSEIKPMSPPGLNRLVRKCMAKDPRGRWQSASDLADELRWIAQSGSQAGIPATVSSRRRVTFRLAWLVASAGILLSIGLGTLYYMELSQEEQVIRSSILAPPGAEYNDFAGGQIAISPDGTKLAFVAKDSSSNENRLWVRALNSVAALPLPETKNAAFPFWSPDGKYIAFFSGDENKLKKILATGGPALTICEASDGRSGSWNENDLILFTPSYEGAIYKVAAAGGEPEQVTTLDTAYFDYTHRWVTFLPDQDHFLFFVRTESSSGSEHDAICLGSLSDTSITRLINTRSNVAYANGFLFFMREAILMAQPFDPGSLEFTGDAVPFAEEVTYLRNWSRGVFSVSNTGHLIYRKGEVNIGTQFRIYSESGKVIDTIGEMESQFSFALSHDETRMAVQIEDQANSNEDIWIYDLTRRLRTRFTFNEDFDAFPVWSPNDSQIVFRSDRNDKKGLYVRNAYGSDTARLLLEVTAPQFAPYEWSHDGRTIIYGTLGKETKGDIKLLSLDSNAEESVYLQTQFGEFVPALSPDSRWLAYASDESGENEVYVSSFPTHSSKWQVSINGGFSPQWSSDGRKLYFLGDEDYLNEVDVDGSGSVFKIGKIERLFSFNYASFRPYAAFDDGRRFLVNEDLDTKTYAEMILVLNWAEELKK